MEYFRQGKSGLWLRKKNGHFWVWNGSPPILTLCTASGSSDAAAGFHARAIGEAGGVSSHY